ncbi:MAG: thiamine phosphate synthase [Rikenellaceae bacterium]|nr:thiamine phosphate synthase [Rikenellaceae bacterium]
MEDFGLYVIITRPVLPYTRIAEICVETGVRMLQLREKHLCDREMVGIGREIKPVTRGTATRFVMNDRADLALLADADVLHLGQGDLSLRDARRIVGRDMMIGLSTHSLEQAREAIAEGPDYIGFGPVYPTTTKAVPDPTVGTGLLREVLGFATVPVVAIGGIFPDNLPEVTAAGARNVCLVRHLMESPDLETRIRSLQQTIG